VNDAIAKRRNKKVRSKSKMFLTAL